MNSRCGHKVALKYFFFRFSHRTLCGAQVAVILKACSGRRTSMQVYVKTDSYGGLDVRFPMSLKVLKKKDEPVAQQQQVIENVRATPQATSCITSSTDKTHAGLCRITQTTLHHRQKTTTQMRSRTIATMKKTKGEACCKTKKMKPWDCSLGYIVTFLPSHTFPRNGSDGLPRTLSY